MSTYAIFGMTWPKAKEIAEKQVDRSAIKQKLIMTPSKRQEAIELKATEIMESDHTVRLSDLFDAPQFALDYRQLASRLEHRDLHMKAYHKTGEASRTGKEKRTWSSCDNSGVITE